MKHRNKKGQFTIVSKFKFAFRIVALIILALGIIKVANMYIDMVQTKEAQAKDMTLTERLRVVELNEKLSAEQSRQEVLYNSKYGTVEEKIAILGLTDDEAELIRRESSFSHLAKNNKSTARGLFQLLTYNRKKYANIVGCNPDSDNPRDQVAMGRAYIAERYGNAGEALKFWDSNNYY